MPLESNWYSALETQEGERTFNWYHQKMHQEAGRRWVNFSFTLIEDQVREMGIM